MNTNHQTGPIRVLRLIARLNVGGPARHVASLMTGLDAADFAQTLVAGRVQAGEDDLAPALRAAGVDYLELPSLGRALHPLRDLVSLWMVLRLMLRLRPHVVDTHTAKAGAVGRTALMLYRPLARLTGRPLPKAIHTFHGHTFAGYFGPLATRLFLAIERFLAKNATWRIVAISPAMRRELCELYGVGRPEQFVLLPLGIPLEPFDNPAPARAAFRAALGVAEGETLIGAVGRVAAIKNYGLLLATAAALQAARPELYARARFAVIGGGDPADLAALRAQAQDLGVAERLLLVGNQADPAGFMPGLDALCLTSLNEGTPMAILEAGACGVPVVATAVGGVPDLLGEVAEETPEGYARRGRGLTARSGDAAGLCAALARLMDDAALAAGLGAALLEHVRAHYDQARLIADTAALYRAARQG
ncbi:MAG: glycosyltransferase [Thermodesulfobacteriota bacterium]